MPYYEYVNVSVSGDFSTTTLTNQGIMELQLMGVATALGSSVTFSDGVNKVIIPGSTAYFINYGGSYYGGLYLVFEDNSRAGYQYGGSLVTTPIKSDDNKTLSSVCAVLRGSTNFKGFIGFSLFKNKIATGDRFGGAKTLQGMSMTNGTLLLAPREEGFIAMTPHYGVDGQGDSDICMVSSNLSGWTAIDGATYWIYNGLAFKA